MNTLKKGAWVRRLGALGAALALAIPAGFPAAAEGSVQNSAAARPDDYAAYLAEQAGTEQPIEEILLSAADFYPAALERTGNVSYESDCAGKPAVCFTDGSAITFSATARRAGLYRLEVSYRPLDGVIREVECALRLGGGLPFAQADSLLLPKQYEKTVAAKDNRGNDIRPSSVVRQDWTTHTVADSTGMYGALLFPLSAGENRLTLTFSTGTVAASGSGSSPM